MSDKDQFGLNQKTMAVCVILCALATLGNLWLLYPEIQARSDCANECNAALQKMYDSCVIQNGIAPNITFEGNLSGANSPSYEYRSYEEEYVWGHPNGSLEVLE